MENIGTYLVDYSGIKATGTFDCNLLWGWKCILDRLTYQLLQPLWCFRYTLAISIEQSSVYRNH